MLSKLSDFSLKLVGMTCTQLHTAGRQARRDGLCRRLAARWRSATQDAIAIRASSYTDLTTCANTLPQGEREVVLRMAARFQTTCSADVWRMPTSHRGILAGHCKWQLVSAITGRHGALRRMMKGFLQTLFTQEHCDDDTKVIELWADCLRECPTSEYRSVGYDGWPSFDESWLELLHAEFHLPPEAIGACPALWQASLCWSAVLMAMTWANFTVDGIEALADATFP